MKILIWIPVAVALFVAGFAAGFPVGKSVGFTTGSEWALVQADILARESGLFMPVSFEDGRFRVIIKQPRNFYKRAWRLADRHDEKIQVEDMAENSVSRTVQLTQDMRLMGQNEEVPKEERPLHLTIHRDPAEGMAVGGSPERL